MVWKALENIGDYKIGDTVPAEIAVVWTKMYKTSPVEEIKEVKTKKVVEEVAVEEIVEEPKTFFGKKKKK